MIELYVIYTDQTTSFCLNLTEYTNGQVLHWTKNTQVNQLYLGTFCRDFLLLSNCLLFPNYNLETCSEVCEPGTRIEALLTKMK